MCYWLREGRYHHVLKWSWLYSNGTFNLAFKHEKDFNRWRDILSERNSLKKLGSSPIKLAYLQQNAHGICDFPQITGSGFGKVECQGVWILSFTEWQVIEWLWAEWKDQTNIYLKYVSDELGFRKWQFKKDSMKRISTALLIWLQDLEYWWSWSVWTEEEIL